MKIILFSLIGIIAKSWKIFDDHIPIINPFSRIKIFWDLVILLTIVGLFFSVSLQFSFDFDYFQDSYEFMIMNGFTDETSKFLILLPKFLLLADTLMKFVTGFYSNGTLVEKKKEIILNNLRKNFIIDIVSFGPTFIHNMHNNNGIIFYFFELFIFLRMGRIRNILWNFKETMSRNGKNDYLISLLVLAFKTFFFCHINACIWHLVAYHNPTKITWLEYSQSRSLPWSMRYYYALFWSVAVMVTCGFGEKVSPQTTVELLVGVWIMLSSALYLGYTINAMGEIFQELNKNEKAFQL